MLVCLFNTHAVRGQYPRIDRRLGDRDFEHVDSEQDACGPIHELRNGASLYGLGKPDAIPAPTSSWSLTICAQHTAMGSGLMFAAVKMPRASSSILPTYSRSDSPVLARSRLRFASSNSCRSRLSSLTERGSGTSRGTLSGLKRPLSDLAFIVPDISQCRWVLRRLSRHQTRQRWRPRPELNRRPTA